MKKTLLSVLSMAAVLGVNAQMTPSVFKGTGSINSDEVSYSLSADENRNIYVGGVLSGSMTDGSISVGNAGGLDAYFAKYNSNGQMVWAKAIGGTGTDRALSVTYNKGFLYVSGIFNNTATFGSQTLTSEGQDDGFLAKYDSSGKFIWVKQFGSTWLDRVDKAVFATNGDLYLSATLGDGTMYEGNPLNSAGGVDGYVFKLDTAGHLLDYVNIGGSSNEYIGGISIKNGSLYVTGLYFSNTFTAGSFNISKIGGYDGFALKMDGSLNTLWLNSFGGSEDDGGIRTLVDDNGNTYVGGYGNGSIDFDNVFLPGTPGIRDGLLAKYDSIGNLVWARRAGTNSSAHYRDIRFINSQNEIQTWGHFSGNVVIAGQTYSAASASTNDIFSVTYSPNGAVTEVKTYGGVNEEYICEAITVGNAVWMSGSYTTATPFNGSTFNSVGGADIGLWKFVFPTTGVKDVDASNSMMQVFPNPSTGSIELQSDKNLNQVIVFDQLGKVVYRQEGIHAASVSLQLDVPVGIYIIKADTEAGTLTQKLVIKQ